MRKFRHKEIIAKYLNDQISVEEKNNLLEWLKIPENQSIFKKYVETDLYLNWRFHNNDYQAAFSEFIKEREDLDEPKELVIRKNKIHYSSLLKYAAIFIGVLVLGSMLFFDRGVQENMIITSGSITLKSQNEPIQILPLNGFKVLLNMKGAKVAQISNGVLSYMGLDHNPNSDAQDYHVVTVPAGKKLQVIMHDGTQIHLNSKSILKYPSHFIAGEERAVFLEGEAFFNVTKNKDLPFIVNTNSLNTKVYGTQFNVSAYKNDKSTSVVLVEGSVAVNREKFSPENKNQNKILFPSQKASRLSNSNNIVVEEVDVTSYLAWMDGIMLFENEQMKDILRKLERRFDVEFDNRFQELDKKRFSGTFDIEDIEHILNTIKAHTNFEYRKYNNKIIIRLPKKCKDKVNQSIKTN